MLFSLVFGTMMGFLINMGIAPSVKRYNKQSLNFIPILFFGITLIRYELTVGDKMLFLIILFVHCMINIFRICINYCRE